MVIKSFNSVSYTSVQINFATAVISANHKQDYRVIGNTEHSITFLCRTGYHWSTIAEILWHTNDDSTMDYNIKCSLTPGTLITRRLLDEYAEKHITRLSQLIDDYVSQSKVIQFGNTGKKRWGFR